MYSLLLLVLFSRTRYIHIIIIYVYYINCVHVCNLRYMFTNIYTPTDETNENFTISHPSMCMCTRKQSYIYIYVYTPRMIIEIWWTQYLHIVKQNSNKVFLLYVCCIILTQAQTCTSVITNFWNEKLPGSETKI